MYRIAYSGYRTPVTAAPHSIWSGLLPKVNILEFRCFFRENTKKLRNILKYNFLNFTYFFKIVEDLEKLDHALQKKLKRYQQSMSIRTRVRERLQNTITGTNIVHNCFWRVLEGGESIDTSEKNSRIVFVWFYQAKWCILC